jgi:hypothetical protein
VLRLIFLISFIPFFVNAQFTISGTVSDNKTGETLIGAIVSLENNPKIMQKQKGVNPS